VEGYIDALRLMASGIEEVVAPLGTALTENQAALLRKHTRYVFLLYDSDAPGLRATFRTGDELLKQGVSVRVVTLPVGEDPDSFVHSRGAAALEEHIASAIDVFERKIQILDRAGWFGELQKKRRALDRLLPTVRATADPLMRDLYINRTSEVTGVDRAILARELGTVSPASTRPRPAPKINVEMRARRVDRRARAHGRGVSAERELIRAMLHHRARVEGIAERVGPDSFRDAGYRAIFAALLELGDDASMEELALRLDADDIELVERLAQDSDALINAQRTIDDSLAQLEARDLEERLAEVERLYPLADGDERSQLDQEQQRLVQQMRASGKMSFKAFRRGRAQ